MKPIIILIMLVVCAQAQLQKKVRPQDLTSETKTLIADSAKAAWNDSVGVLETRMRSDISDSVNIYAAKQKTYNVLNYGAVGDSLTDDADAIIATFAAISENNARVLFPSGQYRFAENISVYCPFDNVQIDFVGSAKLVVQDGYFYGITIYGKTSEQDYRFITGFDATNFAGNITAGTDYVPITDSTDWQGLSWGIKRGDLIEICGSENSDGSGYSDYYKGVMFQFDRFDTTGGNQVIRAMKPFRVNLDLSDNDSLYYDTGLSEYWIASKPLRNNITVNNADISNGKLVIYEFNNAKINDIRISRTGDPDLGRTGLELFDCTNINVNGFDISQQETSGFGYGIVLNNVINGTISNGTITDCRHNLSTGSDNRGGGVFDITYSNIISVKTSQSINVAAQHIDTHDNTFGISYNNIKLYGGNLAFLFRGDDTSLDNITWESPGITKTFISLRRSSTSFWEGGHININNVRMKNTFPRFIEFTTSAMYQTVDINNVHYIYDDNFTPIPLSTLYIISSAATQKPKKVIINDFHLDNSIGIKSGVVNGTYFLTDYVDTLWISNSSFRGFQAVSGGNVKEFKLINCDLKDFNYIYNNQSTSVDTSTASKSIFIKNNEIYNCDRLIWDQGGRYYTDIRVIDNTIDVQGKVDYITKSKCDRVLYRNNTYNNSPNAGGAISGYGLTTSHVKLAQWDKNVFNPIDTTVVRAALNRRTTFNLASFTNKNTNYMGMWYDKSMFNELRITDNQWYVDSKNTSEEWLLVDNAKLLFAKNIIIPPDSVIGRTARSTRFVDLVGLFYSNYFEVATENFSNSEGLLEFYSGAFDVKIIGNTFFDVSSSPLANSDPIQTVAGTTGNLYLGNNFFYGFADTLTNAGSTTINYMQGMTP